MEGEQAEFKRQLEFIIRQLNADGLSEENAEDSDDENEDDDDEVIEFFATPSIDKCAF